MSAPRSHTTVVTPRSHAAPPQPGPPAARNPIYTKRQILVVASLIGLVLSVLAALIVLVKPGVVPLMPEGSTGRNARLPAPFLILPGGCALITIAMLFWMPAPWYSHAISILGIRRRRQNWALVASGMTGGFLMMACVVPMVNRQINAPVAVMREGHYELREHFQTVREISAAEYREISEAQRHLPGQIVVLGESIFCTCMYLGMALYGAWYLRTDPQVDWRDGFWDQFTRW